MTTTNKSATTAKTGKMLKHALSLLLLLIIMQGCNSISKDEEQEIVQKATHSTRAYFQAELGWDVVIEDHESLPAKTEQKSFFMDTKKEIKRTELMPW